MWGRAFVLKSYNRNRTVYVEDLKVSHIRVIISRCPSGVHIDVKEGE